MIPAWQMTADNVPVTQAIAGRLIRLRYTDEAGFDSDELELTLDDRSPHIAPPRRGAVLRLSLGYQGRALTAMGAFVVDEVALASPPRTLTIRARGVDFREILKQRADASREDITAGELVEGIAGEAELIAKVSAKVAQTRIQHLVQRGESALALLSRVGQQYGFTIAVKNETLVAVEAGAASSASGEALPAIALDAVDLISWDIREADRDAEYGSVTANWTDMLNGEDKAVTAGAGNPARVLPQTFATETEAQAAVEAELARVGRRAGALTLLTQGNPLLLAESRLSLTGIGPLGDGDWRITRAEHALGQDGYRTRVTAERFTAS